MIQGISHLTFIVKDLDRMSRLLVELLDGTEVYSSGERTFSLSRERFFIVGGQWIAIMEGNSRIEPTYDHVAFKIDEEDYEVYTARIERLGLRMKPPRERIPGEGRSIYFYDEDGHLFELHTGTLEERLASYEQKSGKA